MICSLVEAKPEIHPGTETGSGAETHSGTFVLLGLGSNLGDRRRILEDAWFELAQTPGIDAIQISRFYDTEPAGGPVGQPNYLNAVALIRTVLEPETLLAVLMEIERHFGRVRQERWGARTLDLDILLFGDQIISTPTLTVPHPEMLRRGFVMGPALEIVPEFVHPVRKRPLAEIHDDPQYELE